MHAANLQCIHSHSSNNSYTIAKTTALRNVCVHTQNVYTLWRHVHKTYMKYTTQTANEWCTAGGSLFTFLHRMRHLSFSANERTPTLRHVQVVTRHPVSETVTYSIEQRELSSGAQLQLDTQKQNETKFRDPVRIVSRAFFSVGLLWWRLTTKWHEESIDCGGKNAWNTHIHTLTTRSLRGKFTCVKDFTRKSNNQAHDTPRNAIPQAKG